VQNAARPLRSLATAAALIAAAVLVVLPAVHGAHASHLAGASVHATPLPALDATPHAEAQGCPLCAAVGHARSAIAPPSLVLPALVATATAALPDRDAAPPALALASPGAPRAPPARV